MAAVFLTLPVVSAVASRFLQTRAVYARPGAAVFGLFMVALRLINPARGAAVRVFAAKGDAFSVPRGAVRRFTGERRFNELPMGMAACPLQAILARAVRRGTRAVRPCAVALVCGRLPPPRLHLAKLPPLPLRSIGEGTTEFAGPFFVALFIFRALGWLLLRPPARRRSPPLPLLSLRPLTTPRLSLPSLPPYFLVGAIRPRFVPTVLRPPEVNERKPIITGALEARRIDWSSAAAWRSARTTRSSL